MKNILKHKNKIIIGGLIAAMLAFVYWWGGDAPSLRGWNPNNASNSVQKHLSADEKMAMAKEMARSKETLTPLNVEDVKVDKKTKQTEIPQNDAKNPNQTEDIIQEEKQTDLNFQEENATEKQQSKPIYTEEKEKSVPDKVKKESAVISPSDNEISSGELKCTISVRCDTILNNMDWLGEEKAAIVPKNGVVFTEKEVVFYEGESVFNVLLREMKKNKIHFEFMNTPIYNSAYIEGIANLYEYDCGELSGWMYRVNGIFPSYGSSRYTLKQGDKIEWVYTCDLGYDVGGGGVKQKDD